MTGPAEDAFDSLEERLRGEVRRPGEAGYDDARHVWNARVDREPAAIARPRGAADVVAAVGFARERGLPLTVKGGGHHVSGAAVRDGALTLDLAPMDGVRVDPETGTAQVQAGATVGDVDAETQALGLATPLGQDPNIGVGGLTLGGGYGWISRTHGLAIDNLVSADVVTADGELVAASETTNPELFWALRGGGGNFGVVTAFEFDCHPVGPEIVAGSLVHPIEDAAAVSRGYRDVLADAPREVGALLDLRDCPPIPAVPESVHGERVAMMIVCAIGDPEAGERALAPLRELGEPIADTVGGRSYLGLQRAGESQGELRTHVRNHFLGDLSEAAIETMAEAASADLPGELSVFVAPHDGAIADPAPDATAYPNREAGFYALAEARWRDPAEDDRHVAWVESAGEALAAHAGGPPAANFLAADEVPERARAAYGANAERLAAVKREWDPENVFEAAVPVDPDW